MPRGFFATSLLLGRKTASTIPLCGACGFYKHCKSPKMAVRGKGRRRILLLGDFPSEEDDTAGKPLSQRSTTGRILREALEKIGVDLIRDCWSTNALICRPHGEATDKHLDFCRPNLTRAIAELKPAVIIPFGGLAIRSLIASIWRDHNIGEMAQWIGWQIPCTKPNVWICPVWHPVSMLRDDKMKDLRFRMWMAHLKAAARKTEVPWNEVPDYESQVECIVDDRKAAARIDAIRRKGGLCAFDYETNMLKPDHRRAAIACASICWEGKETIAYPWHGQVIEAHKQFLADRGVAKVAANMKFEDRWSNRFKMRVRNWEHDTMLCGHLLDNRPGITGLKFQAFVRLGVVSYDDHIKPLLKARKGEVVNRITTEIDLHHLLLYCGLDSLHEWKLARIQKRDIAKDK